MRKQTSSLLLRLGINRGWNLNFLGNLKFYSISLKHCLFLFLLFKSQLIKKKFWLVVQFIFFNFKKCLIKLFFWQFFSKIKKTNKIFQRLKKKKFLISKKNTFLSLKNNKHIHNLKNYLTFRKIYLSSNNMNNAQNSSFKNFLLFRNKNLTFKKKITKNIKKSIRIKKKLVLSFSLYKKTNRLLNFYFLKKSLFFLLKKKSFLNSCKKTNYFNFFVGLKKNKSFFLQNILFKLFSFKTIIFFNLFKKYSLLFLKKSKFNTFSDFLLEIKFLKIKNYFKLKTAKESSNFFYSWYFLISLIKTQLKNYSNFFNFISFSKANKIYNKNFKFEPKRKFFFKQNNAKYPYLLQQIYLKIWQLKLKKIISNLLPGEIKIVVFDIIKVFRKSVKRKLFEEKTITTLAKKLPFFARILVNSQPLLIFNLVKLFGFVFKVIGTTHILSRYFAIQIKMIRKHWHFLRLVKLILNDYWKKYSSKIAGCKIALIGKINGSNRTRKIIIDSGFLNIQRFSSLVDYSLAESFSLFGIFGIKIWLQFF